ncbi:MAG: molybdopterin-dependent oxidoreductase [Nitrososphaeraceae archaeon]
MAKLRGKTLLPESTITWVNAGKKKVAKIKTNAMPATITRRVESITDYLRANCYYSFSKPLIKDIRKNLNLTWLRYFRRYTINHISIKLAFIVGICTGGIAVAIALVLRLAFSGPFIPEIASQTLFSLTPGAIESQAVETLGPLAKYSALVGAIIANLIVYGLLAIFFARRSNRTPQSYLLNSLSCAIISFVIFLSLTIVLLALTEGQAQSISILSLASYLIIPQLSFGFTLYAVLYKRGHEPVIEDPKMIRNLKPSSEEQIDQPKRQMLRAGIAAAVAIPVIYLGLESLLSPQRVAQSTKSLLLSQFQQRLKSIKPKGFEDPKLAPLLDSEVTPTDLFYRIDKNALVPEVNPQTWSLKVTGLVNKPLTLDYRQIKSMIPVEQFATLECVSNKIGGDLISTAAWKGVHLKDILGLADVKSGVKYVVFRCADGYDVGIPIDRGLLDGSILAYEMNGASLTAEHGFPLRAIVPGLYGMMNPKWITEIELVAKVYEGYWQRKGWTNSARYNTHSFIVIPGSAAVRKRFSGLQTSDTVSQGSLGVPFGGMAYAGDRGILKVEVSTDGGTSWKSAQLKDPLSQYTWVLWATRLDLKGNKSNHNVYVRATDKTGRVQTAQISDPFPNGATGYYILST